MAMKHYPIVQGNVGATRAGCGALIAAKHIDRDSPTCPKCIDYKARTDAHWEAMRQKMRERGYGRDNAAPL